MTPVNSHTVMAMMTGSAVLDWASHGWASVPSPMSCRTLLNCPLAAKISRNTGAITAGASTTGVKMMTLYRPASLTRECSSAANVKPSAVCTQNVMTKNTTVCRIVWPNCRGTTYALGILSVIGALKTFDVPYLVTVGGPNYATEFLGTFIYRISIPQAQVGYGAALSILLLILALGGAIVFGIRGTRGRATRGGTNV